MSKTRLGTGRSRIRKGLNYLYFGMGIALGVHPVLVGVNHFREHLKRSRELFILAPGASINLLSDSTLEEIARHDSLGIGTFIVHEFRPSYWLFEAHPARLELLDYLSDHPDKLQGVQVLYKGYNSPAKLRQVVSNLRQLPGLGCRQVVMLKDGYLNDFGPDGASVDALLNRPDDEFYNFLGSILFCLGLAYRVGYQDVVLCGFDFSDRYFYQENPRYRAMAEGYPFFEARNLIASDGLRATRLVGLVKEIANTFASDRDGTVSQLDCTGPLVDTLRQHPSGAGERGD